MAGGKLKFSQITKGKSTLNFVIDAMKVQNKKITGQESKQTFLQGKHILTFFFLCKNGEKKTKTLLFIQC